MEAETKNDLGDLRRLLREVVTHMVDYGSIKVGTDQSAKLIAAARLTGAFSDVNRGKKRRA